MGSGRARTSRADADRRTQRSRSSGGSSRTTLHPERIWKLFKRAGWLARLLAVALLLVALLGAAYLVVPFKIITRHPAPPPLELLVDCPPPVVSAVAGAGGLPNPVPTMSEVGAAHDQLCTALGRRRSLTGLLLMGAGVLNLAGVLEWARIYRRRRRRTRVAQRPRSGGSRPSGPERTVADSAPSPAVPDPTPEPKPAEP
jgi:hypothetical protein